MHSFLNQPTVTEQDGNQVCPAFANHLGTTGAPSSLGVTASYSEQHSRRTVSDAWSSRLMASATTHMAQVDKNTQASCTNEFWLVFEGQSQFIGPPGWTDTYASTPTSEASTTGGIARANRSQARSAWDLILSIHSHRTCITTVLALPGLSRFRPSNSNRIKLLVRIRLGTQTQGQGHQPLCLHVLLHQRATLRRDIRDNDYRRKTTQHHRRRQGPGK